METSKGGAGFPNDEQGFVNEEVPFYKVSDMNLPGNEMSMKTHNNSVSRENAAKLRAFIFPKGTIIFAKVGAALLLNKRRILTCPSCLDNNMMGFIREICDLNWLYYWMCSLDLGDLANPGAVPSVNEGQIREIRVPVPAPDQQHTIAAFLDRETALIDGLIAKKQRQIELLLEKRAALISHAVTKGLNPNVKMKDSGIEWLGEIPEYWEVVRIKYVSSINDETLSETTYPDCEILYIDIGSVDAASGIQNKELLLFEDAPSRARRKVRHGDVIVSTVRTYLRAIAPIIEPEDNLIVSTGFAVIRPHQRLDSGFAACMLRAPYFVDAVVVGSVGVSYPAINASEIGNLCVTIPPSHEQHAIAAFLDRETARIDGMIEKVEESIDLLREYRTALISAAVTGKIDVWEEMGT